MGYPHVVVEHVVAPERLAESVHARVGKILLPVQPPEVHPVLLPVVYDVLEHVLVEKRILQLPWHNLCGRRIHAHVLREEAEVLLIAVHSVGRMQVHRHLQSLSVHPSEQSLRVGNKFLVPCPACPALRMPVHVQNHNIYRNVVFLYVCDDIHEVLLRVTLILAVPVSENEERRHGLFPADKGVVVQRFPVFMTVTEEIPVHSRLVHEGRNPRHSVHITVERERAAAVASVRGVRFVDDRPSCAREQTVLELGPF